MKTQVKLVIPCIDMKSTAYALMIALLVALPVKSFAQGALETFVSDNNGSAIQASVAAAIDSICPELVNVAFNGLGDVLAAPDSPNKDVTLRCNELVQTAVDLNTGTTQTPRGLRIQNQELLAALQQVNGEEISAKGSVATRASNGQFSNLGARLGALRLGSATAGGGIAANFSGQDGMVASTQPLSLLSLLPVLGGGAAADDNLSFGRWGMFVNGSFNTGSKDASALENEFDFDSISVTAGIDYNFGGGVLGFSVGYDDYSADFKSSPLVAGGGVDADGFSGAVFGLMNRGNFYLTGIGQYGKLDYSIDRDLVYTSNNPDPNCQCPNQNRALVGSPDGDHVAVGIDAGFDIWKGNWSFSPHLGVKYRDISIDGYTETDNGTNGGMNLRYGDQSITSLRSVLGIQINGNVNADLGSVRPTIRLDWHHEFDDDARQIQAKYAAEDGLAGTGAFVEGFGPGCLSCFSIITDLPDEDFFVGGLGLSIMFRNAFQGFIFYEGLVGYDGLTANAISIGFRGQL